MEPLTREELTCLRALETRGGAAAVSAALLERLLRLGLVQRRPLQWLPLENQYSEYVLTVAGRAMLRRSEGHG